MVATAPRRAAAPPALRRAARPCSRPGDVLVVNTSATRRPPPSARAGPTGPRSCVHFAGPPCRASPPRSGRSSSCGRRAARRRCAAAPASASTSTAARELELAAPVAGGPRLWLARPPQARRGGAGRAPRPPRAPVRYGHLAAARPLADHQTAFALHPGSAEMPSAAGRSRPSSSRGSWPAACSWPRSRCTRASPPPSATSAPPRALRGPRPTAAPRRGRARLGRPRRRRRHDRGPRAGDRRRRRRPRARRAPGGPTSSSRPSAGCAPSTAC